MVTWCDANRSEIRKAHPKWNQFCHFTHPDVIPHLYVFVPQWAVRHSEDGNYNEWGTLKQGCSCNIKVVYDSRIIFQDSRRHTITPCEEQTEIYIVIQLIVIPFLWAVNLLNHTIKPRNWNQISLIPEWTIQTGFTNWMKWFKRKKKHTLLFSLTCWEECQGLQ